jgi:hypothetical protein
MKVVTIHTPQPFGQFNALLMAVSKVLPNSTCEANDAGELEVYTEEEAP